MMKFAEGGYVDKPVIIQGDAESMIPDQHFGSLYKALALDALLLELEGEDILIEGRELNVKQGTTEISN